MKKISKFLKWTFSIVLVLGFISTRAQETKADTIHLTTEEIVNGETIVWDTIILITPENKGEINEYLKKHKGIHLVTTHEGGANIGVKTFSINGKKFKTFFDTDVKMDVKMDGGTKMLTYTMKGDKLHKHDGRIKLIKEKLHRVNEGEDEIEILIESDEGGEYEIIIVGDSAELHSKHTVWMSNDDKAKNVEFVIVDGEDGKFNVKQIKDSIENVILEFVNTKGKNKGSKSVAYAYVTANGENFTIDSLHEDLDIVKRLKLISKDENVFVLKDGDVAEEIKVKIQGDHNKLKEKIIYLNKADKKGNMVFFGDEHYEDIDVELNLDVSDEELAELGIKTKPNELKAEDFWMFYSKDKELRLKFSLDTEGKTTIKILDAKGKSLFTDKVVYFPGTYDKKIKLGDNAGFHIYVYIEQGNASTIKKLSVE